MFNQPTINPGNRTGYTVLDSPAIAYASAQPLVGSMPSDRLKNGHQYTVAQTWLDSQGRETSVGGTDFWYVLIPNDAANYQINLQSVTPPVGAVGSVIYIDDYTYCISSFDPGYIP